MSSRLPKILFKTPWAWCWRWQGMCVYAIQKTPKKLGWNGIVDHTSKLALLSFTAITYTLLLSVPSILTPPLPKRNQNGYSMWKFEESTACFKLIQSLGFISFIFFFFKSELLWVTGNRRVVFSRLYLSWSCNPSNHCIKPVFVNDT